MSDASNTAEKDAGRRICKAEKPEPGHRFSWLCTLPIEHYGDHVAQDLGGTVIATWARVIPPGQTGGPA